jgi:hypothetical protein
MIHLTSSGTQLAPPGILGGDGVVLQSGRLVKPAGTVQYIQDAASAIFHRVPAPSRRRPLGAMAHRACTAYVACIARMNPGETDGNGSPNVQMPKWVSTVR